MIKRAIEELLDTKTGRIISSGSLFADSEENVFKLRRKLKEGIKKKSVYLVCAICSQPVYVAGNRNGVFFFKHQKELGDCPIKTRGKYSQQEINRMKYNGVKESQRHIGLKQFIFDNLLLDQRFQEVHQERIIKSKSLNEWKKPDVSCMFQGARLVFEIQLSTTFQNIIIDREVFYKNEGIYIAWVFYDFNPSKLRFTEKDIYHLNKSNALVVNEETMRYSKKIKKLCFLCHYKTPYLEKKEMRYKWECKLVTIDDLKFDNSSYKLYYYDFELAKEKLLESHGNKRLALEFEEYWLNRSMYASKDRQVRDKHFCEQISEQGIKLDYFTDDLERMLYAIYSVKHNKVVGYKYKRLIELANMVLEYNKDYAYVFLWALIEYERKPEIETQDTNRTFKKKVETYKQERKNNPHLDESKYDALFTLLFPKLEDALRKRK